jgi:hypothetical protein
MSLFGDGEIDDLQRLIEAMFGPVERDRPPEHWVNQSIQLQHNQGSITATVPAWVCREAGIDRDEPPEVTVYYDPVTGLAFYDLTGRFEHATEE